MILKKFLLIPPLLQNPSSMTVYKILICIKKIIYKIFEKTNINRHNAKLKYGTYAQKIVLSTYIIMQAAYKKVENAHKNNKNAQKECLL